MHDPFPLPRPTILDPYISSASSCLGLRTLPLHYHELLLAFTIYHLTNTYLSPSLSRTFFPRIYPTFNARTKLNWDVHVVSFVQSVIICGLALWVMGHDEERSAMSALERVHGYTGASGLIQAFAGGYFLWDLVVTVGNVGVFGWGMLAHAVSALCVFGLGFRPFVNFYAPTFILYELSSPFLNIHWFCDKLGLTGSTLQLLNGIMLLVTFFSCRIVWGTYHSVRVFGDVYRAMTAGPVVLHDPEFGKLSANTTLANAGFNHGVMRFADGQEVPFWLAAAYLLSNITLNGLNWFWFGKMISTLRKRFDPPFGTKKPELQVTSEKGPISISEDDKILVEGTHVSTPAAVEAHEPEYVRSEVVAHKTGTHLEVRGSEVRSRRRG